MVKYFSTLRPLSRSKHAGFQAGIAARDRGIDQQVVCPPLKYKTVGTLGDPGALLEASFLFDGVIRGCFRGAGDRLCVILRHNTGAKLV